MPSSLLWCFGEEVGNAWSFAKEGSGKQKLTAETLKKRIASQRKVRSKDLGRKMKPQFQL